MHRSGTSAVAGFLAKAGFFAGADDDLLAPAEDNPKGFFERQDVNALNDSLLAELGGAWDKPPSRRAVSGRAAAWRPRAQAMVDALAAEATDRPLVLKDPRICLLLPAWEATLEGFAFVLVDRSPMDVAASIRRRDGRPLYVALALWQSYCTEMLAGLSGRRVVVVHYEDFVRDPQGEGQALLEQLSEALPGARLDAGPASGFVTADMRHHSTGTGTTAALHSMTGAQLALARWIAELPAGWCTLDPPAPLTDEAEAARVAATEHYDAVADRHGMETAYDTERHRALHFEQATELKDRHIDNIEAALTHQQARAEAADERATRLEEQCRDLQEANEALQRELAHLRQDSRAAAGNLVSAARRALGGHGD